MTLSSVWPGFVAGEPIHCVLVSLFLGSLFSPRLTVGSTECGHSGLKCTPLRAPASRYTHGSMIGCHGKVRLSLCSPSLGNFSERSAKGGL